MTVSVGGGAIAVFVGGGSTPPLVGGGAFPVVVGGGATAVYTGPPGRGVTSFSYDPTSSLFTAQMSDGTIETVHLADPGSTTLPPEIHDYVISYVTTQLAPVLTRDEQQDEQLEAHASGLAAQVLRLDAIVGAMIDFNDVATDTELAAAVAAIGISSYLKIDAAASTYAPKVHGHTQESVTGLKARLEGIDAAIVAATGVDLSAYATGAAVIAAVAPYVKLTDADERYAAKLHGHAIADVTNLTAQLNSRFLTPATGVTGHVLTWNGSGLTLTAPAMGNLADYLTIASANSAYLAKSDASNTYLAKTDASATYLAKALAGNTYLAKADAASDYLTKSSATSDYLSKADAGESYLSKADASHNYLNKDDASNVYLTREGAGTLYLTLNAAGAYLSAVTAAETYLAKSEAADTYLTKAEGGDLATYLTRADATDFYLTKGAATDFYLTKSTAADIYQAKGDLPDLSAYLTKTEAGTTYLSVSGAGTTYLSKNDATTTYLSISGASGAYLLKTDAGNSYLLKTDAASTYQAKVAGTAGKVLKHNGTAWAAEAQYAIADAKGDLFVGSGPDAAARLAAGANGQVLTADSTQATGMKWATAAAAPPPQSVPYGMPGVVSLRTGQGRWYNDLGARTLTKIRAAVGTAPIGSPLTVQVMINGVAAGSVSIASGSETAVASLSTALPDGAYITVNVTAIGSTTPGYDLVVNLTHQAA